MKKIFHVLQISFLSLSITLLIFSGCGQGTRDVENYGDISNSPQGIILSDPVAHMGGYGRTQCLVCHNAALNLHRDAGSPINVDQLKQAIINNGESTYCLTCHGPNGTQ